ncbi:MAG: hypothetical protein Kow0092_03960 [Deferrisomatales bacterium]
MMDTAAATRGLREFPRIDPHHRAHAEGAQQQAAAQRLVALQDEVSPSAHAEEVRVRDREERSRREEPHGTRRQAARDASKPEQPPVEQDEGHLLDITI